MSYSRIRDLDNANFGRLNANKNKHIMSYDSATNTFILISADNILEDSVLDGDLPNDFASVLESEVDPNNIKFTSVDGGSFWLINKRK